MNIFVIMIRTILKSNQNNLTITLPDNLVGKLIEVIAFEIKEEKNGGKVEPKKPKLSQLRGFLSKKSSESMHDHVNQSRAEWDTL
jgi:hypothetical protein